MTLDGPTEQFQVISAFQQSHHTARSMLLGDPQYFLGHLGEVRVFEHEAAERISAPGVEAGGDDNQVRRKASFDPVERLGKGLAVIARGGADRERHIERGPFASAGTALTRGTRAGIVRILMRRKIKDAPVLPENFLRPVTVVHIPINDQHTFHTVLRLRISRANRGIIEEAESHRR